MSEPVFFWRFGSSLYLKINIDTKTSILKMLEEAADFGEGSAVLPLHWEEAENLQPQKADQSQSTRLPSAARNDDDQ